MTPIPKSRPRALDRRDRKRDEERLYRENRAKAFARDGHHCRICGGFRLLECHHVESRSTFGPKRVQAKHDASNLLTVCADCHSLITQNVLKVHATARGADAPVRIERWDDAQKGYVTHLGAV